MAFFRLIEDNDVKIALWEITETEQELMTLVGLDLSNEYSYPRRRMERMAIRALLNHLGCTETVQYHQNGRPYLTKGDQNISISHAGKMVAIALSNTQNVGIDIENVNRNFRSVAKKYLSENELKWINTSHQQSMALAWCIKESIYKLPWKDFKTFTTDIDIKPFNNLKNQGDVNVDAVDQNSIHSLVLKYLFFDEFCLSWVAV